MAPVIAYAKRQLPLRPPPGVTLRRELAGQKGWGWGWGGGGMREGVLYEVGGEDMT